MAGFIVNGVLVSSEDIKTYDFKQFITMKKLLNKFNSDDIIVIFIVIGFFMLMYIFRNL